MSQVPEPPGWESGSQVPPAVRKEQVQGHLMKLKRHKTLAPDDPMMLRELTHVIASHSPPYLKSHGNQVKTSVA